MRRLLLMLAACDSSHGATDATTTPPADEPAVVDESSPIDAPVLPPCANPVAGSRVTVRRLGFALGDVGVLVNAPAGDPRLFVTTRGGAVRIVEDEQLRPTPFIDLAGSLVDGGEQGLLGLAFHPSYHLNRQFFVYFTKRAVPADTLHPFRDVVARCQTSATDPYTADPASCVELLSIKDPATNHNGGMMEFGRDGYLYIGTGDGGHANDPDGDAQTLTDGVPVARSIALLGKILRIDVDHVSADKPYAIPADNPFIGSGAPEVYALGLRNPWRWSFDTATGDIWIGDVGQDAVEELDVVRAGELAGKNFGWSMWEGSDCLKPPCTTTGMTFAQKEHRHDGVSPDNFAAIIGGQVYRGTCYPDLAGTYFYTDNSGGLFSAVLQQDGSLVTAVLPGTFPGGGTSIHAAATGELYLTLENGSVYHVEARP